MVVNDFVEFRFQFADLIYRDLDITCLAADSTAGLVHHDAGMLERGTFTFSTCTEKNASHGSRHSNTNSSHIRTYILQCVIHTKTGINAATGTVDVHIDISCTVGGVEK